MSDIEIPVLLLIKAVMAGLCEKKDDVLQPTELGLQVLNEYLDKRRAA